MLRILVRTLVKTQITRLTESGEVSLDVDVRAGNTLHTPTDATGIFEIEQMLNGKTLSRQILCRDDLKHLTEILQSRIVVQSDADECAIRNSDTTRGAEAIDASMNQKNPIRSDDEKEEVYLNRVTGEIPTPFPQPTSLDLVGASPIDIARAYMGTRTSEVGVASQSKEESTPLPANGFLSKTSILELTPKSSICWPGAMVQQSNSYLTPKTDRGRAGLQSFRSTPYSRAAHSRSTSKLEGGGGRSCNILSTNVKQLQTSVYGGSQVTKTSISYQNDGLGSVGPIRGRHRKFLGTTTPSKGTSSSHSASSGTFWDRNFDVSKSLFPIVNQNIEPGAVTSSSANGTAPSSSGPPTVHPQSTDLARKILEHLDRSVPTPEKKSVELNLATSWRKPPTPASNPVREAVNTPVFESLESRCSNHILGQKLSDLEKDARGTSIINLQPEQRKPDETTDFSNQKTLGSRQLSSELYSRRFGAQFDAKVSADLKTTPEFKNNSNEVCVGHDESSQSENIHPLRQQSQVGGQPLSRFSRREESIVQKKVSGEAFEKKRPLTSISITKCDPKCGAAFENGSGFTFPVSSGSLFEPPTPSVMPSFSAMVLPQPKENGTVPTNSCSLKEGEPSYSFGSTTVGRSLVFSFPSSSSSTAGDFSTPKFSFGSDKARLSFRSVREDIVYS
ncbi:hypothetical protein IFM89_008324 [Coptis chinensis]|uniref:Nuclear pore complex protein n=1 Tax=Coptis chinensis TaxID=261450 RepID=A0A835M206_9MAGN|nr:hypothetical protein IFM89_008324 [Coptis chinensis]